MKTPAEYLALSKRYRVAKLGTRDPATREQLETFERSYFLLAKSLPVSTKCAGLISRLTFEKTATRGSADDPRIWFSQYDRLT